MKTHLTKIILMAVVLSLFGCKGNDDPSSWSDKKVDEWFNEGEWKNGWQVKPDNSISKRDMAISYFRIKDRWDSAFAFLKNSDLSAINAGRHDIDGNNLYVSITDYNTKNEADANYEAHRKYADIQYVASGKEQIGIVPLSMKDKVVQEYNETNDIEFFTVKEPKNHPADPGVFFVFFPGDAHEPGLKVDTIAPVRKVVVKVRLD